MPFLLISFQLKSSQKKNKWKDTKFNGEISPQKLYFNITKIFLSFRVLLWKISCGLFYRPSAFQECYGPSKRAAVKSILIHFIHKYRNIHLVYKKKTIYNNFIFLLVIYYTPKFTLFFRFNFSLTSSHHTNPPRPSYM